MRIDKYIATATDFSRDQTKNLLKQGKITINGEIISKANHKVAAGDLVELNDIEVAPPGERYFMLNKPEGYVSATKDSLHPCVTELLFEPNPQKLKIVGRLDIDTTGLLLITTDGKWSHKITSPKAECPKRYIVGTSDPINQSTIEQLIKGVYLKDEHASFSALSASLLDEYNLEMYISEGKYHQVKRMLAATGNRVTTLSRDKIGELTLDENLAPGEYRALTEDEIALFN